MSLHRLLPEESLPNGEVRAFEINEHRLLAIKQNQQIFLLENKCGHFGIPLHDGRLTDGGIICLGHGIEFSLCDGSIVNRPYENCDAVKTFQVIKKDGWICVELDNTAGAD